MTFPQDLDEIDEAQLQSELAQRQQARSNGYCVANNGLIRVRRTL